MISSSTITISDDLKKSVACASVDSNVFTDHSISPFIEFTLNKSPEELLAITSPCLDKASDYNFCDLIKDDIDRMSQIMEPSLVLSERSLLS